MKASSLLQIMNLMNLTSPVLRGHAEGEVKMTILTGKSLCCYLSTRILMADLIVYFNPLFNTFREKIQKKILAEIML